MSETTRWRADRSEGPEPLRERAVQLGLIGAGAAREAWEAYSRAGAVQSFSSFLLAQGHLDEEQLLILLQAEAKAGARAETPVAPGQRYSGCVVEAKLGEGGMGSVYRARSPSGQPVVIKFPAVEAVSTPTGRARFLREGLVVRDVVHPNVVRIHAVEVEGLRPHIVMELVEGEDLEERLARGPLPWREATRIARDVARGLAAAHAKGVVHRDIKPGNIRLATDGTVKILDFGLARSVQAHDGISLAGQILGTPHYMAPEQWGEHRVDERCDVFSLGATLYHLVCGELPFPGRSPATICRKVQRGEFTPPRERLPELPEDLELAILRMLSRERRDRYPSAEACAADLERVLAGRPVDVPCLLERARGRRHPLLPGTSFLVGRGADCDIQVDDMGASRHHLRIERSATGYELNDLGSTHGTAINGIRVERMLLRRGDRIQLGKSELEFHDGGLGKSLAAPTLRLTRERMRVQRVPEPTHAALVAMGDRRTVLSLLERLPEAALDGVVDSTRVGLRRLFGGELAEEAARRLSSSLRTRRAQTPERLFAITHENLGDDLQAWLDWWDAARVRYPPQLAPQRLEPRRRLRIVEGNQYPRLVALDERVLFSIGRDPSCGIPLASQAVSRQHAQLVRLHEHLMIRDEGSRFGTRLRGEAVRTALLRPGDRLTLGDVDIVLEAEDLAADPPRIPGGQHLIAPELFEVLVELRHPSVVTALYRFLLTPEHLEWVDRQGVRLIRSGARARDLIREVKEAYEAQATTARELLPLLVPGVAEAPEDAEFRAWWAAIQRAGPELPLQVLPVAWFPGPAGGAPRPGTA